jgi:hypothetical protein
MTTTSAKRSVYKSRGDGGTARSAGIPAQRLAPFGCRRGQAKRLQISGDAVAKRSDFQSGAMAWR